MSSSEKLSAYDAESYGDISTSRDSISDDLIPDGDSDDDDDPFANPVVFETGGQFHPLESKTLADAAKAAAGPVVSKVCKVLITGESTADSDSIYRALEQVELEVREYYKTDHVIMNITKKLLRRNQLNAKSIDQHLPASEITNCNAIIIAIDSRPINLALFGGAGARLDQMMEKFVLFGTPEMSIYFIATGDRCGLRWFLSLTFLLALFPVCPNKVFSQCVCMCRDSEDFQASSGWEDTHNTFMDTSHPQAEYVSGL
jgi:hypothetical protein